MWKAGAGKLQPTHAQKDAFCSKNELSNWKTTREEWKCKNHHHHKWPWERPIAQGYHKLPRRNREEGSKKFRRATAASCYGGVFCSITCMQKETEAGEREGVTCSNSTQDNRRLLQPYWKPKSQNHTTKLCHHCCKEESRRYYIDLIGSHKHTLHTTQAPIVKNTLAK